MNVDFITLMVIKQGSVLPGFLFPVNPLKKKKEKKKILRISLKTLFIDFVLVI